MPKSRGKKCKCCGKHFNKWAILKRLNEHELNSLKPSLRSKVKEGDLICNNCYGTENASLPDTILKEKVSNEMPSTSEPLSDADSGPSHSKRIKLDIPRATSSSALCIVCGKARQTDSRRTFKTLLPKCRAKIFVKTGIVVTDGVRVCLKHFDGDFLSEECYSSITSFSDSFNATSQDIKELLNEVRVIALQGSNTLNFDDSSAMVDTDYMRLTGVTKSQFDSIMSHLSTLRSTSTRSSRTALALLLVKLRTGLSLSVISTLFGIRKNSCSKAIHAARTALMTSFVPKYLGLSHIDRDQIIRDHTSTFAKVLFADSKSDVAIAVADGTYIYIEKSSNYAFQRRSYSIHKGQPLLKPMMLVATDGYILTVLGPYLADGKNSDAKITEHMLKSNAENINEWFHDNDVLVVDRDFRDAIDILKDFGINAQMPHFLNKSQRQHSTEEANESRLVTKVRWVVESVNGRIKKWKALSNTMPNTQIPYIGDYVRIVCSICNAFRPALVTSPESDEVIAKRMMAQAKNPNKLQCTVVANGWDKKRVIWEKINESELNDFPELTENELRDLTMGVYQLKQARCYTDEHFDENGQYEILAHKEQNNILKAQIRSRHTSNKSYNLWIEYGQGLNPINGWYCQCKCGARTVGCCAHVASALWFLGYYRYHTENSVSKTNRDYMNLVEDAAVDTWSSSSESEEEN